MPLPQHLNASHLRAGVVPSLDVEDPAMHRAALVSALDLARLRLDLRGDLLDAWRERLPRLPDPPRTRTLQEAVQAARVRLRSERAIADRAELDARTFVVAHLRDGLR
jgi:hypothetical protein